MAKRFRVVKQAKDQRKFTRTAIKTKRINVIPLNTRGGGCL